MAYNLSDRKLSQYHADTIRELNSNGVGQEKLAKIYGVSRTCIKSILQGKTYVSSDTNLQKSCKNLQKSCKNIF